MRIRTRIHRGIRAVSPVLSVLLMIIVAVAGSLVTYAWVMGYIDFTTNKAGKALQIQSVAPGTGADSGYLFVYVQNVGDAVTTIDPAKGCLYINDMGITPETPSALVNLSPGETATLKTLFDVTPGDKVKVRVVSTDGSFMEYSSYPAGGGPGGGGTPTYQYRKAITFGSGVQGTQADFPVLISISGDTDIGGKSSDGHEIYFTSSDGTTKLSHELEQFSVVGGAVTLAAWVKVPSLSTSTQIYIYYGETSLPAQQNPTAVWTNGYVAVYHLNGNFEDSTSYSRDGTSYGTTSTAGMISSGREFNPDDGGDRIELGTWSVSGNQITMQAWVRFHDLLQDDPRILTKATGTTGAEQDHVFMLSLTNSNVQRMRIKTGSSDGSGTQTMYGGSGVSANTWYLMAGSYDGTLGSNHLKLLRNGAVVYQVSKSSTGNLRENSWTVMAGNNPGGTNSMFSLDGDMDEIRLSSIARSTDWMTTEYNNIQSPGGFRTIGVEEIV